MLIANSEQDLQDYDISLKMALNQIHQLRCDVYEIEDRLPGLRQSLELAEIILIHEINANGDQIDAKQ